MQPRKHGCRAAASPSAAEDKAVLTFVQPSLQRQQISPGNGQGGPGPAQTCGPSHGWLWWWASPFPAQTIWARVWVHVLLLQVSVSICTHGCKDNQPDWGGAHRHQAGLWVCCWDIMFAPRDRPEACWISSTTRIVGLAVTSADLASWKSGHALCALPTGWKILSFLIAFSLNGINLMQKKCRVKKSCSHEILLYLLFYRSWRTVFPRMTWVPEPTHWSRKMSDSNVETQTCSPGFGQSPHLAQTHIMLCAEITHRKCFVKYKTRQLLELMLLGCLCLQGWTWPLVLHYLNSAQQSTPQYLRHIKHKSARAQTTEPVIPAFSAKHV